MHGKNVRTCFGGIFLRPYCLNSAKTHLDAELVNKGLKWVISFYMLRSSRPKEFSEKGSLKHLFHIEHPLQPFICKSNSLDIVALFETNLDKSSDSSVFAFASHNALQLPVFFLFSFFCQPYAGLRNCKSVLLILKILQYNRSRQWFWLFPRYPCKN